MATINIDKLAVQVMTNLDIYLGNTVQMVEQAVEETAELTVEKLNRISPVGTTGKYAESWDHKKDSKLKGKNRYSRVVYSEDRYRLTHLLERGHAKVNGGRVAARPHIKNAEKFASDTLYDLLVENLKG